MAIWNGNPQTLEILNLAAHWKNDCLLNDGSLIDNEKLWTLDNLNALYHAFFDNPLFGKRTFIEKLSDQVDQKGDMVQKLCSEVLLVLFLFPHKSAMGAIKKAEKIDTIFGKTGVARGTINVLGETVLEGIGNPGIAFQTKVPDEFGYLVNLSLELKKKPKDELSELLSDPWKFGAWLDLQNGSAVRAFRHICLYLLFPEYFERIASKSHKRDILAAFSDKISNPDILKDKSPLGVDRAVFEIRKKLEVQFGTKEIDFYKGDIENLWLNPKQPIESPKPLSKAFDPNKRFWIEKTNVKGRPDREAGEYSLGNSLWSPHKSSDGKDIYKSMREVKQGDLIFHLVDNAGIAGISVATSEVINDLDGLESTAWAGQKCIEVKLEDYIALDPFLDKQWFFNASPYNKLLSNCLGKYKNLFFTKDLEFRQGAYLTELPPEIVSIFAQTYLEHSGKSLPHLEGFSPQVKEFNDDVLEYSISHLASEVFLDEEEIDKILTILAAKRNIIIQGPPGVGKSFAARRLAYAHLGRKNDDNIEFVQFHQSYSYEDFVEGYKPYENGFKLKEGKFVSFCRKAQERPDETFVFIIDEINRGNLSKILGELMLLIEPDKRDPKWALKLASGDTPFYVPENVYIIGLMNTADRSLSVVDYALRRRFSFLDFNSKVQSLKFRAHLENYGVSISKIDLIVSKITALNNEIIGEKINLGKGFEIGHSYFCDGPFDTETEGEWWIRVASTEIIPLLKEYWFDNEGKIDYWEAELLG